ncbi:PREDICTED: uncharacterized protein LOC107194412 [Dufourea novaeangliae]|uniref:uncharacterized protein LOC107194412 n=1 Tax=Dufourea novaeangliae TaxID=178035 RepID=UPI000767215C|nr:PREDICTED: uncharacterized protein LOC107194412 [Dufourea novaeangliae]
MLPSISYNESPHSIYLLTTYKQQPPRIQIFSSVLVCYLTWLPSISGVENITRGVARHLRSIGFPEGSGMGIFFALGVPIDIPNKSVLFSLYFEANYGLPGEWNSSYYLEEPYIKKRGLDRRLAYDILTNKLESFGYSGKGCLLKMICETANDPLTRNGVVGDVLQILFTPSSSQDENLPSEIIAAEYTKNCYNYNKECPQSPLALIRHYELDSNS